jgi:hypothetical protein
VAIQVPYAYPTNAAPAMETPASKRVGAVDERGASDVRAVVTKRSRPLKRQKVCDGGVDGAADAASGVLVSDADPCCAMCLPTPCVRRAHPPSSHMHHHSSLMHSSAAGGCCRAGITDPRRHRCHHRLCRGRRTVSCTVRR